jgi:plasmid stabilization system protein ParE
MFRSRVVLGSFVIIDEPSETGIRVARILHGARHLRAELERDSGGDQ